MIELYFNVSTDKCYISDLQQHEKKQWNGKFNHFVETTAYKATIDKIKEEQCLIICGPHGCGKSSLVFHTAMKLEKTQGFDVMIISDPDNILRYASKDRKQLFLIDDVFGKYSVREYDTMWWERQGKSVQHLLTRNRSLRLLMTSRLHIYRSVNLKHMNVKACSLNLISQELIFTPKEIEDIGIFYLREDTFDHLKENVFFFYNFFPALCAIFSNNNINNEQSNVVEYFTHPVAYIKTEIENFKDPINQFYLALAVLIVCGNSVKQESFDQDNHTNDKMLKFLSKEIGYGIKPKKHLVRLCLTALTDSYVSENDSSFECLHVNLFNVLAFCIGPNIINSILKYGTTSFITERMQLEKTNKYNTNLTILIPKFSQDLYLERMLLDLKSGLHYIFKCNHHVLPEVRKLHIQYMETHLKNGDLRKGSGGTTVLHVVSEEGYEDYVIFFLRKKPPHFPFTKAFVNEQDNLGQTALHKACIKEHLNVAKLLLDKSTNINTSDNDDKTALDIACSSNSIDIVDLLLSRRATISQKKTDFKSVLHVACENNYLQIVELILRNNANLDQGDTHGNTPLHLACKQGHVEIVDLLLNYKPCVNVSDNKGRTALFLAVNEKNIQIVKSLLEKNANTNKHTDDVRFPLHCACQHGSLEIARLLIKHNAKVDIVDLNECAPLYIACKNGHFEVAKLLLEKKAKANKTDILGNTPILAACKYNHIKIVKLLLDNEADVNCKNKDMMTPLYVACTKNNMDIVLVLIRYGALINEHDKNHNTPLLLACLEGHHIVATELTRYGASVNMANQNGETPLYITCKEGHEETVKMLLNAGANVNQVTNEGMTPLHMACKGDREHILKLLLNAGVDLNMANRDGSTPLELIQKSGRKKIVSLVLKANESVTQSDSNEMSPLCMACKDGNKAAVQELLNACVNINEADSDGITPLHVACKGGREEIVTLLINSGVRVNTGDRNGITPLHLACEDGNKAIVKLLLYSFANVNMGDNEGTTALHIACKSRDQDIVTFLLAAGAYVNTCNKNGVTPLLIAFNSGSEETLNAVSNLSAQGVADEFVSEQSTCKGGREDIVRLLLKADANVNPAEKHGMVQIEKKSILEKFNEKS